MNRYAVRIIGPSGMTTYLAGDMEVTLDEATVHSKAEAWQAGWVYRNRFANQNFTYDVVNLDDPEEQVSSDD